MRRVSALLASVLLTLTVTTLFTGPARAEACSGSDGVTVVVQSADDTKIGCAAGDPKSGMEALEKAGFKITRVAGQAAFICQINGLPADADCSKMPPATAFWAYFQGKPGAEWAFSQKAADQSDPAPGSLEGWRIGKGDAPTTKPADAAAATAAPTPATGVKEPASDDSSSKGWLWGLGVVAVVVIAGGIAAAKRSRSRS